MLPIILAGGSGTRFWPASRRLRPKQLLRLFGEATMLAQTLERFDARDDALIVCGPHLVGAIRAALPELGDHQLAVEPSPMNTAPAIALGALLAAARFGEDEVVGVFPSDHHVGDVPAFRAACATATEAARAGAIVTLGITPDRPETGFGYIHYDPSSTEPAPPVRRFVEKPDADTARAYLDGGAHLWNAGMFFFTPRTLRAEIARQLPEMDAHLDAIAAAIGTPRYDAVLAERFPLMPRTSIDYGVMEGAERVRVVPAEFGWSDVGHWAALHDVLDPDADGNVTRGDVALHEVTGSVVHADSGRLLAAVGVDDLVIVDTPDAVLVMPRSRAQDVRAIVGMLEERGRDDLL